MSTTTPTVKTMVTVPSTRSVKRLKQDSANYSSSNLTARSAVTNPRLSVKNNIKKLSCQFATNVTKKKKKSTKLVKYPDENQKKKVTTYCPPL